MSKGSDELSHLAQLIRLSASTARQIALIRSADASQIGDLADHLDQIATDFESIVHEAPSTSEALSMTMMNGQDTERVV